MPPLREFPSGEPAAVASPAVEGRGEEADPHYWIVKLIPPVASLDEPDDHVHGCLDDHGFTVVGYRYAHGYT